MITLLYDVITLLYYVISLFYDVITLLYDVITLLYDVITLLYDKPVSPILIFSDWGPAVNVKMINVTSIFVLSSELFFLFILYKHFITNSKILTLTPALCQ